MMDKSESINELAAALSKAQGQIKGAIKDSTNPFFKSQYADLTSVWEACRESLTSNGLSVIQHPEEAEKGVVIETMLCHSSGQWISSKYVMPVAKVDAQTVGSAITYGRRYALAAMVGVAPTDDDDGNSATKNPPAAKKEALITTDQAALLKDMLKDTKSSTELFLSMFGGIKSVHDIPAKDYQKALGLIEEKKAKQAKVQEAKQKAQKDMEDIPQ